MQFNSLIQQVLDEMAQVKVSDLSNWPSYTHPEFEGTSGVFQNKYGKKYTPQQLETLIKNAVLEISKDPNLAEIEDKQLAAELVKAFRGGSMSPTTADVISKRAVKQLLDSLKSQPNATKQTVAKAVAVAAKAVEQKPEQAEQIAAASAETAVDRIEASVPEPTTEPSTNQPKETPEGNIEMPSGEVLTKNEKLEIFNSTITLTISYYELFLEKIKIFNAKSAKKDIPPIEVQFIKSYQKETRNERLISLVDFKVIIPPLILGGAAGRYKFVAKIDHTQNNVISIIPGSANEQEVINKYAEAKGRCERVGCADRKRNATFIVQDTSSGKLIQLGKICLEKYIGGAERSIISLLGSLETFTKEILGFVERTYREENGGDDGGGGGGGYVDINKASYAINDVLGFGLMLVKSEGFKPAAAGEDSTAQKIRLALSGEAHNVVWRDKNSQRAKNAQWLIDKWTEFNQKKDSYAQSVDNLVQWGLQEFSKSTSDSDKAGLIHNVKALLGMTKDPSGGFLKGYSIGKIVWIIPKFLEATDENFKRPEKLELTSNYIGTKGGPIGELNYNDKRKLKKMGVEGLDSFPYNGPIPVTVKDFWVNDGHFGLTTLINMIDERGNVYVYRATGRFETQKGEKLIIQRALVKNHQEYTNKHTNKTIKQTVINYAVLLNDSADESLTEPTNESVSFAEYYALAK